MKKKSTAAPVRREQKVNHFVKHTDNYSYLLLKASWGRHKEYLAKKVKFVAKQIFYRMPYGYGAPHNIIRTQAKSVCEGELRIGPRHRKLVPPRSNSCESVFYIDREMFVALLMIVKFNSFIHRAEGENTVSAFPITSVQRERFEVFISLYKKNISYF